MHCCFCMVQLCFVCVTCHRENKNRYVLAFLKSLVDCGVFEHIYLNFLPVGHTHCDIDELFSRIAVWIRGILFCSCLVKLVDCLMTIYLSTSGTFIST